MLMLFNKRKEWADRYAAWIKDNPEIKDCPLSMVTFLVLNDWEVQEDACWIPSEDDYGEGSNTYTCSKCHNVIYLDDGTPADNGYEYCPHCGRKWHPLKNSG